MGNKSAGLGGKTLLMSHCSGGVLLVGFALACSTASSPGEDRPGIQVIGESGSVSASGSVSGSVSASGVMPAGGSVNAGAAAASPLGSLTPSDYYTPVSNVDSHAAISLDMRDIASLLNAANTDDPVDWAQITSLYENGLNSVSGNGSVRTLQSLATSDSVIAEFPGGADLDGNVQVGLTGNWLGENVDDPTRRQLINKGIQGIIYGKVMQELSAARAKIEAGNTDDSSGAPHNVDEAWAFYIGVPGDDGDYPHSISATARKREANFGLEGEVDAPLQEALAAALEASRNGDLAAYDAAAAEVRGYLNGIFYMASLRYGVSAYNDDEPVGRKVHLAEGWAFYQTIEPAVSGTSSSEGSTVQAYFEDNAANAKTIADVDGVYAALNDGAVRMSLGLPDDVYVVNPLQTPEYAPVSNVVSHANIAVDMRDIANLLNAAKTDAPVDWAAIASLYENGMNSVKGDGSVRTLKSLATSDSVIAEFPGGTDLDGNIQTGLTGTWLGESIDDPTRRQLINKGIQAVIYGKVLQELTAARTKIEAGNTDDDSGAPHNVDEAWAFYVGAPGPDGRRNWSIASTARSRAGNFGLKGMLDVPLQEALADALEASRNGDLAAFDAAADDVRGYLNTIFYLASLRYGTRVMTDEDPVDRKIHLAEGWAFYQSIHPAVQQASANSANTVTAHFERDAANPVPSGDVDQLYAALNAPEVIQALGIPAPVRVTSPSQLQ